MTNRWLIVVAAAAATLLGGTGPALGIVARDDSAHRVPDYDRDALTDAIVVTAPSMAQRAAAQQFLREHPQARLRFDPASGSIDALYNFATAPLAGSPQEAALAFVAANQALLGGLGSDALQLDVRLSREALGGYLLRFNQVIDGVRVEQAGLGIVVDAQNRVRALFGPVYPQLSLDLQPALAAPAAVARAAVDLAGFARTLPAQATQVLEPGFQAIEAQLGPLLQPQPELRVVMAGTRPRLAWTFYQYSRNPFGLFQYQVDARDGTILRRIDQVRYQEDPTAQYADYFPTFPTITPELREDCALLDAEGGEAGKPLGQLRIQLRKFDASNRVTGVDGVLSGDHALIQNALPSRAPFAQAAAGTYFFDRDEAPLVGRTDERDHLKEPAEHQDGISQFIYITALLEYLDYLHKAGDAVHSRGVGSGQFPDSYPNESTPLAGIVHIPNVIDPPGDPEDPAFVAKLLGLDNAFAVPVATEVGGQEVVVNPTAYGHGYLLNNLAIDFAVPMHEGTHATITPIAGFEGSPEGPALNEGQADLWAYTIGETPDLGTYPINACGLLAAVAADGGNPDSYQFIRSAQSQLRYGQLGTRDNVFEEHRDGEIYAGAMWDIREFMTDMYPDPRFVRPDPITGEPTQPASLGKETWERIFLGSMYVLGITSPDTMTRARDALLVADSVLYPANAVDIEGPGRHFALIERAFAARELGLHAAAPLGGRQTVSSGVSAWTAARTAPPAPQQVSAAVVDARTVEVSWAPVEGATAYQVLKRRHGDPRRLFTGVPGREYFEGDAEFSGYTHVEYVFDGTTYRDHGQGFGRGPGQGLDSLAYDYVVRAVGIGSDGQVGFSALSGTASVGLEEFDASDSVDARMANVYFDGSRFGFDQTLANTGTQPLYRPLRFEILEISEPSVSVANADNGGSGRTGDPALFVYDQSLLPGEVSAPRALVFDDPLGKLFRFTARVTATRSRALPPATGSQPPVDVPERNAATVLYHYTETHTGLVPVGSAGLGLVDGVDYVDVNFVAAASALGVDATLSATPEAGGAYPDLDFELRDSQGRVLASSGNLGPNEALSGALVPGEAYALRVVGFANGPSIYEVFIDQIVTDPDDAGEGAGSGLLDLPLESIELEFVVDPLTRSITPAPRP